MRIHELKIRSEYYEAILNEGKTFELRKDDRGFSVGDKLRLQMYDALHGYTGASIEADISYILRNAEPYGLRPGYAILGLTNIHAKSEEEWSC